MRAVPILQALCWGDESPLLPSGEVDFEALAQGLARAGYRGAPRPKPYTRAQHALVVSEAVDTLAGLRPRERRVMAMHAWLAQVRDAQLRDNERAGEGKKRVALRTMDIEALADVFAGTDRWDEAMAPGAVAFDECLKSLGGLDAHERRRLSLYALLTETVLAGLGTPVAEAALRAAGLTREAPASWVHMLRLVRRVADAAVSRDLPGRAWEELSRFPAIGNKIVALGPGQAAQRWLARYRSLTAGRKDTRT